MSVTTTESEGSYEDDSSEFNTVEKGCNVCDYTDTSCSSDMGWSEDSQSAIDFTQSSLDETQISTVDENELQRLLMEVKTLEVAFKSKIHRAELILRLNAAVAELPESVREMACQKCSRAAVSAVWMLRFPELEPKVRCVIGTGGRQKGQQFNIRTQIQQLELQEADLLRLNLEALMSDGGTWTDSDDKWLESYVACLESVVSAQRKHVSALATRAPSTPTTTTVTTTQAPTSVPPAPPAPPRPTARAQATRTVRFAHSAPPEVSTAESGERLSFQTLDTGEVEIEFQQNKSQVHDKKVSQQTVDTGAEDQKYQRAIDAFLKNAPEASRPHRFWLEILDQNSDVANRPIETRSPTPSSSRGRGGAQRGRGRGGGPGGTHAAPETTYVALCSERDMAHARYIEAHEHYRAAQEKVEAAQQKEARETMSNSGTQMQTVKTASNHSESQTATAKQAYIHSRMRAKTSDFLKVLNRARPEQDKKEKKTFTGRSFQPV